MKHNFNQSLNSFNIPNNSVLSSVPYLQQLNRFILRLNFEGGTGIKKLGFIMQNKQELN